MALNKRIKPVLTAQAQVDCSLHPEAVKALHVMSCMRTITHVKQKRGDITRSELRKVSDDCAAVLAQYAAVPIRNNYGTPSEVRAILQLFSTIPLQFTQKKWLEPTEKYRK